MKAKLFYRIIPLLMIFSLIFPGRAFSGRAGYSGGVLFIQQEKTITGVVKDKDGNPLPGVTVVVKGTKKGTITNKDGLYTLKVGADAEVLEFSFVGMKTQDIEIAGKDRIDVVMEEDVAGLDEVVVVGYGTRKKINLSGAVDQVNIKELEKRPITTLAQGLQGMIPNLNIDFASGEPGQIARFNIRGATSINGGNPLILIDGIAASSEDVNRLNPDDIASISILKDAASAAIYGARAAFGVVLIETRKGTSDKVTYNNNFSWSRPTVLPDPITDPYVFSKVLEISTNNTPWDYVNFSDYHYQWAKERSDDPSVEDVRVDPNNPNRWIYMGDNNWNDYFFNDYASSQNHSLSFSGKKDKFYYFASANYMQNNGLNKLAKDVWDRGSLRSRLNFSPFKWLQVDNNTFLSNITRDKPSYSITSIYNIQPIDVAKNPDGTWANTGAGKAAAQMSEGGRYVWDQTGLRNTTKMDISLWDKALVISGDVTFNYNFARFHRDSRKYTIGYGPEDIRETGGPGYVYETSTIEHYLAMNYYGNFNKSFGRHALNILAGYNQESYSSDWFKAQRDKLISSSLPYLPMATGDQKVDASYTDWAVRGVFGRINYIFNDRYIVEFNGRYDGSSRFPKNNRFGFFPSVSAAWVMSKEEFMMFAGQVISTLKFRASYGSLGNQNVSPYGYISTMNTAESGYLINGEFPMVVYAPGMTVDPNNYSWEKVNTMNFGMDMGLLKNRIFTTFDWYTRNTIGMLTQGKELPSVLGTGVPKTNAADLQTKGWELTVTYKDRYKVLRKAMGLNLRFVLSDNRAWITRFENEDELFSSYREGQELGEIWGLINDGFFQSQEEIDALDETAIIPWGSLPIVPGWMKYKDLDDDGTIQKGQSANDPKDLSIIGNSHPRFRFGFNMGIDWWGFDLSVFLQGIGKMDMYPKHYLFWGPYQQPYANIYPHLLDYYRPTAETEEERARNSKRYNDLGLADANTDAYYPVLQAWLADYRVYNGLAIPQTKYLLNAAYMRIKNITIGYTLPAKLTEKIFIKRLRVFLSGENIWEVSAMRKYIDPEAVNSWGGYAYPFQRKYAFGVNVDF